MLTLFQKYYKEFKVNAKDFIKNIEQEGLETKEAFLVVLCCLVFLCFLFLLNI